MLEVTENTPQVKQIKSFKKRLFPYQLSSIYQMEQLEKGNYIYENITINTNIGILSNEIGSGKTLVILGLCKRNKNIKRNNAKIYNLGYLQNSYMPIHNFVAINNNPFNDVHIYNINLIIVPHSIVHQWENELQFTNLSYIIIKNFKDIPHEINTKLDIILCSNSIYNHFIENFDNIVWNRIIIDEVTMITKLSKKLSYNFLWSITNNSSDIYDTRNIKNKSIHRIYGYNYNNIQYINVYCNENYIKNCINLENNINIIRKFYNCLVSSKNSDYYQIIKHNIKKINSENIEDIIHCLELLVYNQNQIIDIFENKIYEDKSLSQNSCTIKLESFKNKINELPDSTCSICLDKIKYPVLLQCCSNLICLECILQSLYIKYSCVFCRSILYPYKLYLINHYDIEYRRRLNKEKQLLEIINSNPNGKFLIYNDNDNYNNNHIQTSLFKNKISFKDLNRSRISIERIINNYKYKNLNVLLLNYFNYGKGLNLQNTTDIIFYSTPTKFIEKEIIGKVNRLGINPNSNITVHYLKFQYEM